MKRLLQLHLIILLSACTLTIGSPSRLPDQPEPTAIPLMETAVPLPQVPGKAIALPPGFRISVFADGIDNPRMMTIGPDGHIYVAERGAGRILRLPDADRDGILDQIDILAEGLDAPSSLAFYQDGSLYVGETTRILRFPPLAGQQEFGQSEVIITDLPSGGHNTRTVLFSPDYSTLFVSIGSSCNICEEHDPRRAAIMRYNPDGSAGRVFAN